MGAIPPVSDATVGIEFSTDGTTYVALASQTLNAIDSTFELDVLGNAATRAFFRLTFDGNDAFIDNVAIEANVSVPEPGSLALVGTGLAGLALMGRRRA